MQTSNSTLTVARMALRAAREAVADYAHRKSPRKFTQPQLVACLVVKEFLCLDYRGIHVMLREWSELREVLGLTKVPHFTTLLGDAGYESERFHSLCRDALGIRSIIPTTERGRPRADGQARPVNGAYRRLMKRRFPKKTYGQRWQIETVFSMLKRNLGAALRARHYYSQTREIRARILTHNIMILL